MVSADHPSLNSDGANDETFLAVSDPVTAPASSKPRSPTKIVGGLLATLAVVVAFAGVFAFLSSHTVLSSPGPVDPATNLSHGIPANWHLYRDPHGLFTVAIPSGWVANTGTGSATEGNYKTGESATVTTYTIALGAPPIGNNSITVFIYENSLRNTYLHKQACQNRSQSCLNTTIDGFPAANIPAMGENAWLLDTNAAHYQINYVFPGWMGDIMQRTAPTPIPSATLAAGQQLFAEILGTFRPTPATPLSC